MNDGPDDEPSPCICDRCSFTKFLSDEATFPAQGEWGGCTLCPKCAEQTGNGDTQ